MKNLRGVSFYLYRFVKLVVFSLLLGLWVKKIFGGDDYVFIFFEFNLEVLEYIVFMYIDYDGRIFVMGFDELS